MTRTLSILSALGLAGAGLWLAQRSSATTAPKDDGLRFTVAKKDFKVEIVDTGKVQPKERIEVKSKVAGQVLEVAAQAGDRVKSGALLLRLDPTDYQREVARAQADLAQAQNAREFAELTWERKKRGLAGRGVAEADVDFAANELKSKTVAVESAKIALATAEDRLRYTRLLAPIDGTILELSIQKGEVVTPGIQQTFEGRPLLVIGDLSTLLVRVELNQIDVAKIALGQAVSLSLDALPGRSFAAKVTKIAPAATKPKGKELDVFPVEATLEVADPAIKPGMTADVRFLVAVRPEALAVPIEAVQKTGDQSFVTRVVKEKEKEKERTEKVEITVGARNDRELEVLSGIEAGDVLLVNPGSSAANEVSL
ncbi:MAG: efflux RND transporter periplasmic adaptor subunit [Myxococcota bacterium]